MRARTDLYRILDANFNRSREGLRVAEEVMRFALNSKVLQQDLKRSRHALGEALKSFPVNSRLLLAARDSKKDVGQVFTKIEASRRDLSDIFLANIQRSKEAIRALEEFSKIIDRSASKKFKEIRFRVYQIEKRSLPKLDALRDHVSRETRGKSNRRRG